MDHTAPGSEPTAAEHDAELMFNTSIVLLRRAQSGDKAALNELLERYLPYLRRWANGRLPRWARERFDTEDLIQEMILAVMPHIEEFEPRRKGAFRAYMRLALLNRIRSEIGRVQRRPRRADVDVGDDGIQRPDPAASPLEETIYKETLECYEAALARLRVEDREAIMARLEMDCSFEQLARVLGKPTANAARMAASRAFVRLAQQMDSEH